MTERTIPTADPRPPSAPAAPPAAASPDVPHDTWRAAHGRRRQGVALVVIVTCQLMLVLDVTIVNIALPDIQRSLDFSATSLAWVLSAYTLTFGGLLLLGGRMGDILGRRRVFTAGIALFSIASLGGGLAPSGAWLLAARAVQGVGAALASPSALAMIATNFEEGAERNRAFGLYAGVSASGSALGLLAGGVLTDWLSWRWVLFVNVPIGVAVAVSALLFTEESERHPGRFDVAGAIASTGGMVCLVYGFIRAGSEGWRDHLTVGSFGAAIALLAIFVAVELRAVQPITPLRLFADRDRSGAYLARLILVAGMLGVFYFLSQFMQEVLGYSALGSGLAFLPITVALVVGAQGTSRLLSRLGARSLTVAGICIALSGMAWLTRLDSGISYLGGLLAPMLLLGLGLGMASVTLTMMSLSGVAARDSGAASSMVNVMQQVGGALGLSILVTVFGTASRHAAARYPGEPARVMTHGVDVSFGVATALIGAALVMVLALVRARRP